MSQQLGSVMIALKAVDECSSVMDKVRASTSLLGSAFQSMGGAMGSVGNVMQGLAAGGPMGALTAAVGETAKALEWAVGEATQSEQAIKNLSIAVEKSGASWDSVKEGTNAALSEMQKFTVYSDEQLAGALQQLLTFGMSYDEAMKALGTTVDFAAAKQMSLESAATIVGKAMDGNIGILKRYGIEIQSSKDASSGLADLTKSLASAIEAANLSTESYLVNTKEVPGVADILAAHLGDAKGAAEALAKAFADGTISAKGMSFVLDELDSNFDLTKVSISGVAGVLPEVTKAFKAMGDNIGEIVGSLIEAGSVTEEFATSLISSADPAKFLIDQFQQGNIELPQFEAVLSSLGVAFDAAALKGGSTGDVLAALNEQFGGTAQEQAKTYAGIQERLKNATSDLGEKIGGILLPALASMTEGMIPIVDSLGKGVDAVQAWMTEVGKMPEVKGAMDALGSAFEGFKGYLESVWKVIVDAFGPALQELWQAFKDIWDALQPAIEAFKEIFGALSAGGESIDPLKLLIQGLAAEIRIAAQIIKEIAPVIKAFADGFKAAADFIAPILMQMSTAIGGFLDGLKTAFQGFYTWLVGGSLWMDMWNALLSVASSMIGTLLGDLGSKLFKPLQDAFAGAMQWVEDSWNTGWQTIHSALESGLDPIMAEVNTRFNGLKDFLGKNMGEYGPIATSAVGAMQSIMNAGVDLIEGHWTSVFTHMQNATTQAWNAIQGTFTTTMAQLDSGVNIAFSNMRDFIEENLGEYAPMANTALTLMQNAFNVGMSLIRGDWEGALNHLQMFLGNWGNAAQGIMSGIMGQLQGIVQGGVSAMLGAFNSLVAGAQNALAQAQALFQQAQQAIAGAAQQVVQTTAPATQAVTNAFDQAYNAVVEGADWLWQTLTGGSIWPNMMDTMQSTTEITMSKIQSTVTSGFASMVASAEASLAQLLAMQQRAAAAMMIAPTAANIQATYAAQQAVFAAQARGEVTQAAAGLSAFWEPAVPMNLSRADMATYGQSLADAIFTATYGRSPAGGPATAQEVLKATLPVSVIVDGVTVSRVVEQRMITQRQLAGGYS